MYSLLPFPAVTTFATLPSLTWSSVVTFWSTESNLKITLTYFSFNSRATQMRYFYSHFTNEDTGIVSGTSLDLNLNLWSLSLYSTASELPFGTVHSTLVKRGHVLLKNRMYFLLHFQSCPQRSMVFLFCFVVWFSVKVPSWDMAIRNTLCNWGNWNRRISWA